EPRAPEGTRTMNLLGHSPERQTPSERTNDTSASLLEGARQGRRESWHRLVHLYTPLVLWWCQRDGLSGARAQDARDVAQNVFLTVSQKITAFTPDGRPGAFRRWLYSITHNRLREHGGGRKEPVAVGGSGSWLLRLGAWAGFGAGDEPSHPPADADEGTERRLLLKAALDFISGKFDARTRKVVCEV